MRGSISPLLQYAFMAWCSVKKKAERQCPPEKLVSYRSNTRHSTEHIDLTFEICFAQSQGKDVLNLKTSPTLT